MTTLHSSPEEPRAPATPPLDVKDRTDKCWLSPRPEELRIPWQRRRPLFPWAFMEPRLSEPLHD